MPVTEISNGVWNLTDNGNVSCFLVIGTEKALLIDTGYGNVQLRPLIAELTNLPLTLVNTHGHGDHVGGNSKFSEFYIHPSDIPIMEGDNKNAIPVEEGYEFDLGGRVLEVIATPGHTPGSISLLDKANRLIFVGDMLSKRPIFFIKGMSDLNSFINSMDKLSALSEQFDTIICCHGDTKLEKPIIEAYKKAAQDFQAGNLNHGIREMGPHKMDTYTGENGLGFICPNK